MSVNSLRQTAAASTLTSHYCQILLRSLTHRQRIAGEPAIALRLRTPQAGRAPGGWASPMPSIRSPSPREGACRPSLMALILARSVAGRRCESPSGAGIRSWYTFSLLVGGALPRSCLPARRTPAWCPARTPGTAAGPRSRLRSPSPA
jgi:hypothetical protein